MASNLHPIGPSSSCLNRRETRAPTVLHLDKNTRRTWCLFHEFPTWACAAEDLWFARVAKHRFQMTLTRSIAKATTISDFRVEILSANIHQLHIQTAWHHWRMGSKQLPQTGSGRDDMHPNCAPEVQCAAVGTVCHDQFSRSVGDTRLHAGYSVLPAANHSWASEALADSAVPAEAKFRNVKHREDETERGRTKFKKQLIPF